MNSLYLIIVFYGAIAVFWGSILEKAKHTIGANVHGLVVFTFTILWWITIPVSLVLATKYRKDDE